MSDTLLCVLGFVGIVVALAVIHLWSAYTYYKAEILHWDLELYETGELVDRGLRWLRSWRRR